MKRLVTWFGWRMLVIVCLHGIIYALKSVPWYLLCKFTVWEREREDPMLTLSLYLEYAKLMHVSSVYKWKGWLEQIIPLCWSCWLRERIIEFRKFVEWWMDTYGPLLEWVSDFHWWCCHRNLIITLSKLGYIESIMCAPFQRSLSPYESIVLYEGWWLRTCCARSFVYISVYA